MPAHFIGDGNPRGSVIDDLPIGSQWADPSDSTLGALAGSEIEIGADDDTLRELAALNPLIDPDTGQVEVDASGNPIDPGHTYTYSRASVFFSRPDFPGLFYRIIDASDLRGQRTRDGSTMPDDALQLILIVIPAARSDLTLRLDDLLRGRDSSAASDTLADQLHAMVDRGSAHEYRTTILRTIRP
jgi:hypothetical protein